MMNDRYFLLLSWHLMLSCCFSYFWFFCCCFILFLSFCRGYVSDINNGTPEEIREIVLSFSIDLRI